MNVITLRDYAKTNNISYEAVRQQVVRYKDELGDHIIRDGRQQFLDEEAVAFLDAKRQKNPVAIIQQDKDERIESLKRELDIAKNLIIELQDERNKLKDEKYALEAENAKIALLEAENASKDKRVEEAVKTAEDANLRLTEAHESFEAELKKRDERIQELENRKWYQLLFKKNKERKEWKNGNIE